MGQNHFWASFWERGRDKNLKIESPPTGGPIIEVRRQDKMRLGRLVLPPHAAHPPRRLHPALRLRCAACSRSFLENCAKKVYKLHSRRRADRVYPHEIDIQEMHPKHRKLDSQAAIPHPTRDRAADGLRPKAWPLRASRRDHDPGRLSPRSAGLGGLRPAMAADRTVRGPLARSPGEEWNP